jgi:hypothetical protein
MTTHPLEAAVLKAFNHRQVHDRTSLASYLGADGLDSATTGAFRCVARHLLETMESQGKLVRDRKWFRLNGHHRD